MRRFLKLPLSSQLSYLRKKVELGESEEVLGILEKMIVRAEHQEEKLKNDEKSRVKIERVTWF